jgi:outer membrane protein assembly factor BamD
MAPRLILVLLSLLLAVPALAQGGGRVRQPEDPETLYNQGLRQMKRGYYDEAIITFERVRNHFPFNQYSVLSELKVADCLYEKSSYIEAVDAYRQFARLHPRHPDTDYVVYRTARSEFKLAPTVAQRDQTHSKRGLRRLNNFETRFPDSEYTPEVERLRGKVEKRLSRAAIQIGNYYYKTREWAAAERRYRLAVQEYPHSPFVPRTQYRRGRCLQRLAEVEPDAARVAELLDQAAVLFGIVVKNYPDSRWAERARQQLQKASPSGPSNDTTGSDTGESASTSS